MIGYVEILAVHNSMSKDDIPAYLSDKGWDKLHFALDTDEKLVWNIVGGSAAMPQTIVLDRDGKVFHVLYPLQNEINDGMRIT